MIYKIIGWSILLSFITYKINQEKIIKKKLIKSKQDKNKETKEEYINDKYDEKKDYGVGTFGALNYTYDNTINRKNKILSLEDQEKIFKYPKGNLVPISENRNILENRIQSFNTDIKIVNKQKIIYELDNQEFNNEFIKMINKEKKEYVENNLDYNKIDEEEMEDDDGINEEMNEERKGLYRKLEKEYVSEKNMKEYKRIEKKILNDINGNGKLKIKGGYNIVNLSKFIVVQNKINYILYNIKDNNEKIYDCEIVIYRDMKNHGKHIGFQVLVKNNNLYIIDIGVIGIVSEDKIQLHMASNEFQNNLIYYKYNDKYVITYNPRETEIAEMSYFNRIWLMKKRSLDLMRDRGIRSLI